MVRKARPGDAEAIEDLWRDLIREQEALDERLRYSEDAPVRFRNDLQGWLSGMGKHFWVAEVDRQVVGFVSAAIGHLPVMFEAATEVYVSELYVTAEFRGAGMGTALLKHVREWGQANGATAISASVLSLNQDGRAFWEKQGVEPFFLTVSAPLEVDDSTAGSRIETRRSNLGFDSV